MEGAGGSVVKNPSANARDVGDVGLIPGSGRFPGGENDNPLQNFCWKKKKKNPLDRGTWRATLCGLAKGWT